jgi:aspartate/methionine/tyrosine aminotransferase
MSLTPNPLVVDTGSPPIPEAKAWLSAYDGRRGRAIDLSQAVPGEPPPEGMLAALARAASDPASAAYGPILGDAPLRAGYAAHVATLYGGPVATDSVAITAGCNLAFVVAVMALARAGDAVLLPAPWYFNHAMTLQMLGVEARALPCRAKDGFIPDPDAAERLIDGKVRALVLVTPNNPTGAVIPPDLVARFAALARRKGLWLVLDETYRDFLPEGARPHDLIAEGAAENLVQLYSFSKAYGIPGHRLGAMLAPPALMPEIGKVLDCLQICAPRVPQAAASWAIEAMAAYRATNRAEIARRGEAFCTALSGSNGWRIGALGAYFAYVAHPFAGVPAPAVAERLAKERGVLALPATYFGPGQEGWLRFAVANVGIDAIAELPDRLKGFEV